MSGTEIQVEIILCPDKELENAPIHPSWPRPAGMTVKFTKQGAKPPHTAPEQTDADGLAIAELDAGTYDVKVEPDAKLNGWTSHPDPLTVDAGKPKKPQQIRLVPPANYRLLALRLCAERADQTLVPLGNAEVEVKDLRTGGSSKVNAFDDGHIYALVEHDPKGERVKADVTFKNAPIDGVVFEALDKRVRFEMPNPKDVLVDRPTFAYIPSTATRVGRTGISIEPRLMTPSGAKFPLIGATVTIELHSGTSRIVVESKQLPDGQTVVYFPTLKSGLYSCTVEPPASLQDWPIKIETKSIEPHYLRAGDYFEEKVEFTAEKLSGVVKTPDDRPLDQDLDLVIYGPDGYSVPVSARGRSFTAVVPSSAPLYIRLAPGANPTMGGIPLEMNRDAQEVAPPPTQTEVTLQFKHGVWGYALDADGQKMPGAVIVVFQGNQKVATTVARGDGTYMVGLPADGDYDLAFQTDGGEVVTRETVTIASLDRMDMRHRPRQRPPVSDPTVSADIRQLPEAFTDLAAYPVLTEEITTTGPPAPSGGSGPGTGYGQAVEQVIRDVLGWRPSADVSGFQAALAGAFELRDVQGHTEWTWQQRGYSVQADLGALTGAQASIYARAKSALDQVKPLLAGLTPLDPSLYPPQDLETIRTIVATELDELVNELALAGGPRIQRVDELLSLLLGLGVEHPSLNPEIVRGQLGTLRDRFGLSVDKVKTLDEERIVTNFRVIVDQVVALASSWQSDKAFFAPDVFSGKASKTSFGTTLIWLSRSLEAVCESVDDLNFAMDSVFVDAAQRQVIEIRFDGERILLADLLEWVVRASRDEGPRLMQDAGKDGVVAFADVLQRLRTLVKASSDHVGTNSGLPRGLQAPRVSRAFDVLVKQLGEAANLAGSVRRDEAPEITRAWVQTIPAISSKPAQKAVQLLGRNFSRRASALFLPAGPYQQISAEKTEVVEANYAVAFFSPAQIDDATCGEITLINEDGTQSNRYPVNFNA